MRSDDIFNIPPKPRKDEYCENIFENSLFIVEKIVSYGIPSPTNFWYEQPYGEWVCILLGEAELLYEDGAAETLRKGGRVYIPPMKKHRVERVSDPCLWLAVKEKVRSVGG